MKALLISGVLLASSAGAFPVNFEKNLHRGPTTFGLANDYVYDTTVATTGDIYVVGSTDGTFSGETSSGGLDAYIAKYNSGGALQWVQQFGTASTDGAYCVTADTTGANVFVAGFTDGTLPSKTSSGGRDAFLYKFTSAGVESWSIQFGTAGDDIIYACTRDLTNNPIVAGSTTGSFSGYTNAGSTDMFVTERTTAAGAQTWLRQMGTSGEDEIFAAAMDSSNRTYVAGYTSGSFSGYTNAGGYDVYTARLSTAGAINWFRQFGTTGDDYAYTLPCTTGGLCYPAGMTTGTWSGQTSSGLEDAWFGRYSAAGALSWYRQFGTAGNDAVKGARLDTSSRPMLLGTTDSAFSGYTNKGYNDLFYTRYTATGTVNRAPVQSGTTGQDSIAANGYGSTLTAFPAVGAANREYTGYTILKGFDIYVMSFSTAGVLGVLSQGGTSN